MSLASYLHRDDKLMIKTEGLLNTLKNNILWYWHIKCLRTMYTSLLFCLDVRGSCLKNSW